VTGSVAGKTVLVTGASSGIGRATAVLLAREGADVVLVSRSREVLDEVRRECEAAGGRAAVTVADVTDEAAVDDAFAFAERTFGSVDAVVHSAAVLAYGRFEDVPAEVFDASVRTTLGGTATVARCAVRTFRETGTGNLVVVGSLLGKIATPYMSSYVTAKWGVHGLVRTLQLEARSTPGISVGLVWPGGVDTPVYLQAGTYLGRHGRPPPPVDPPGKVARAVLRALVRPRREISVGPANRVVVLGFHLVPGVFDRLVGPLMRAGGVGRAPAPPSPGNVFEPQPRGEAVHGRWGRHWLRPLTLVAFASAAGTIRHLTRDRT
jgi:NAD(P)-dependent dehydrogenase (short-subunit alcohol dehydrogenase family)